ncbi:hypothetical protein [Avibacterium paragallinarum]|uniref:hypothetical protein n=1 Tax=Avibacterium paragallinarum TaxID=728 RepID=UPI00397E114F
MLSALIATTRFVAWGGREMQITEFCCYFILILIYKGRIAYAPVLNFYLQNTELLLCHFWIFGLMTFFFGSYNGFRSLSDLLSFAFPKESKQRKAYPIKLLFLIPIKFSSRKVSLMFASLSLGVTFLKILFPFGQFTRERAIFKSAVVF